MVKELNMTKSTFTKTDYDKLLKSIQKYRERDDLTHSVTAVELIIKGILTHKLELKLK